MGGRARRKWMFWSGIGVCVTGLVVGAQIPYFYWRSHVEGARLIQQAQRHLSGGQDKASQPMTSLENGTATTIGPVADIALASTQTLAPDAEGALLGLVEVPSLHLTAPLLEGTGDTVLNVGAGHLSASVQPGMPGTCVIAAHNATWFRHINTLVAGDQITVETATGNYVFRVLSHRVAHVGNPIANTVGPTLVLEACYPLDALYLTSQRYLVMATLVKTIPRALTSASAGFPSSSVDGSIQATYHATVPADLLKAGITLKDNRLPMGSLTYTGHPSAAFSQSNAPLSAVYAMLQLYLAYVRASEGSNLGDLHALLLHTTQDGSGPKWAAEQVAVNPFFGQSANAVTYLSGFNVNLQVEHSQLPQNSLTSITATTNVDIGDSQYEVKLDANVVQGNTLVLENISAQWLG